MPAHGVAINIFSNALVVALQAARHKPSTFSLTVRHLGAFGLFLAAILDSTPLPTFGGVDILTAILAARHAEPWYYYAMVATAGSIVGAYLTFRTASARGADYLQKKFGIRRVSKLPQFFEKWGTSTLVVSSAVPFPFPTSAFFAVAGVLKYPFRRFLIVVAISRGIRYMLIAAVASFYGRQFVRFIRHPSQYYGWIIVIALALVMGIFAAVQMRKYLQTAS